MIRNHLYSQRIKTIKTITGSSMDFFLIYKCLQLARKKILTPNPPPPPPPLPFTPFCLCATISDCFNIFPSVCLRRFSTVPFSAFLYISIKPLDRILLKPHHTLSLMYILMTETFIEIDSLQHLGQG